MLTAGVRGIEDFEQERCSMDVRMDCRHFVGDRPCRFHKSEGARCETCPHYDGVETRILIILLGHMGAVLRATSILQGLRETYPRGHVTWVTDSSALAFLADQPLVDRALPFDAPTLALVQAEQFDLVANLDLAAEATALATLATGKKKVGYGRAPDGAIVAYNAAAQELLPLSYDDELKKANERTFQEMMLSILEVEAERFDILLTVSEEDAAFGEAFAELHRLDGSVPVVGLNIGGAKHWPNKRWPIERFSALAEQLHERGGARCVLLYGEDDEDAARELLDSELGTQIIDGRGDNTLGQFAAVIQRCDLVVTGDTMALHMALALAKKVVALFGPTSAAEVEMYGLGAKLTPNIDCACCYQRECSVEPGCMERIDVDAVLDACEKLMGGEAKRN